MSAQAMETGITTQYFIHREAKKPGSLWLLVKLLLNLAREMIRIHLLFSYSSTLLLTMALILLSLTR